MKTVHVNRDELHLPSVGYGILCWSRTLKYANGFLILSLAGTVDITLESAVSLAMGQGSCITQGHFQLDMSETIHNNLIR